MPLALTPACGTACAPRPTRCRRRTQTARSRRGRTAASAGTRWPPPPCCRRSAEQYGKGCIKFARERERTAAGAGTRVAAAAALLPKVCGCGGWGMAWCSQGGALSRGGGNNRRQQRAAAAAAGAAGGGCIATLNRNLAALDQASAANAGPHRAPWALAESELLLKGVVDGGRVLQLQPEAFAVAMRAWIGLTPTRHSSAWARHSRPRARRPSGLSEQF